MDIKKTFIIKEKKRENRKIIKKWNISENEYIHTNQLENLQNLFICQLERNKLLNISDFELKEKENYSNIEKIMVNEVKSKISSYLQQDKNKKGFFKNFDMKNKNDYSTNIIYDPINLKETLFLLYKSKLICYYCKCNMVILYKKKKRKKSMVIG